MTAGLLSLAAETLDEVAAYLGAGDVLALAVTHSALRTPAQRSLFRNVAFCGRNSDVQRYLQFVLALHARPALGVYVNSFAIRHNFLARCDPRQLAEALGLLDSLWLLLPALKHLHLTMPSLPALQFEGCTENLLSLSLPYCNDPTHRLLLRSNALLRLSLGGPFNQALAYVYPDGALPRVRSLSAHFPSILAIAPWRPVTHLRVLTPISLRSSFELAATLSRMPGRLQKLYLPVSVESLDECALIPGFSFLLPMGGHLASLVSLTLTFHMQPPLLNNARDICASLPTELKSLRTLRLWCSFVRLYMHPSLIEDVDKEAEAVRLAHQRCPALEQVSLFGRIDWHRSGDAHWAPSLCGAQRAAARAWLRVHPDLNVPRNQELDDSAAETESLLDEDTDYASAQHTSGSEASDDESEEFLHTERFLQYIEELLGGLAAGQPAIAQAGSAIEVHGVWPGIADNSAARDWGDDCDKPRTSPVVDMLLDRIAVARQAGPM